MTRTGGVHDIAAEALAWEAGTIREREIVSDHLFVSSPMPSCISSCHDDIKGGSNSGTGGAHDIAAEAVALADRYHDAATGALILLRLRAWWHDDMGDDMMACVMT